VKLPTVTDQKTAWFLLLVQIAIASYSGVNPTDLAPITSRNPISKTNNRLVRGTYSDAGGNLTALGAV
jgi:hypothetical protein